MNESEFDDFYMIRAIELSYQCPPSTSAWSVGAVIVDDQNNELSTGYSRENDPRTHAEETALAKLYHDPRLTEATIYSTLEPCSHRKSKPRACAQRILDAGIRRVVIAWREPDLFVTAAHGYELLENAGVTVTELPHLAQRARAANAHLLDNRI